LGGADPATRDEFTADVRAALQTADSAVIPKTRRARVNVFQDWNEFCVLHNQDPSLRDVVGAEPRLCFLLVFGLRRRQSRTGPTGQPIRAGTVASALLAVGQGITNLGQPDPRLQASGKPHALLSSFLSALADEDDPATRAYPANLAIVRRVADVLDFGDAKHGRAYLHTADLCFVGFYWLLRPAEYLLVPEPEGRSEAFRLRDITFAVATPDGTRLVPAMDITLNDEIVRAYLTFSDQKNAVRGEQVSHAATSDPIACPCKALARICRHILNHTDDPSTPLYAYWPRPNHPRSVKPTHITRALRLAATDLQVTTGIDPRLLSARSLRPGGATALLCANIDTDVIHLLGRWKSDAMLRYLRVAAHANNNNFAQSMLTHGNFTFAPATYATDRQPLPQQTPETFRTALQRDGL